MQTTLVLLKELRVVLAAVGATLLTVLLVHGSLGASGSRSVDARSAASSAPAAGTVYTGMFNAWGNGEGYLGDKVTLPATMAYTIDGNRTQYIVGTTYTSKCPGPGQVGPNGFLCLYVHNTENASFGEAFNAVTGKKTITRTGFALYWGSYSAGDAYAYGQWALKVGTAATASRHAQRISVPRIGR